MPHQCTDCGRTFEDGSKEMLSGCPDCGGNKFQFIPADAVDESVEANSPGDPPNRGSSAGAVSKAATTVRDWVGGGSDDADRPSGGEPPSGEWPKSATEEYETPAEKAAARASDESTTESSKSTSTSASAASGTTGDSSSTTAARSESGSTSHTDPSRDDGSIQARTAGDEDTAQASARSDVVSPDELPDGTATPPDGTATPPDGTATPPDEPGSDAPDERRSPHEADAPAGGQNAPADSADARGPSPDSADSRGQSPDTVDDRHEVADPADTQIEDRPDLDELREELNQQFESIKILNPGQYELNLMELYDREEYIISLREDGRYVIDVPDSWRGDD